MLVWLSTCQAGDFIYHGSFLWNDIRAVVCRSDHLYCAFHDGVASISLSETEVKKAIYSQLELNGIPFRLHLCDDLLAVEKEDRTIDLIDIADPGNLQVAGTMASPIKLFDLERLGNFLYAAVGYDGLLRYDISDPANVVFDDSSMFGINITALGVYNGRLLALDNYNGVLVYEPTLGDIGDPVSELLLPVKPISMTVANDSVYAGIKPTGYLVGSVGDIYHPVYIDTRTSFLRADEIAVVPQGLVIYNSHNGFELQYHDGGSDGDHFYPIPDIRGFGSVYEFSGGNFIVLPNRSLGFTGFHIDEAERVRFDRPDFEYAYPGPIEQLEFVNGRLHVIGPGNPYEIYEVNDPGNPALIQAVINPPYKPGGVCLKGDTIFIADQQINAVFTAVDDGLTGLRILPDFFTVFDEIGRPFYQEGFFTDGDLIYYHDGHVFNGSARGKNFVDPNRIRWGFDEGITAVLPMDSFLYQVDSDNRLHIYHFDRFLELEEKNLLDMVGRTNIMQAHDTLMYMGGDALVTVSISDTTNPYVVDASIIATGIAEMDVQYPELACAADNGIFVYDISAGIPQLLFSGGRPSLTIARRGELVAASDGHSVKLLSLPTTGIDEGEQPVALNRMPTVSGYPNPFNSSIRLAMRNFSNRLEPLTIDIFDILGRKIKTMLLDIEQQAEAINWDGSDDSGRMMASGIYFVNAHNSSEQATLRAVLIK